jgi:hypothetical protein
MTDTTNLNEIVDPNKLIDPALFKFRFKKDKLDNQRPSIELNSFVPSFEGIVAILQNANTEEGKKEYELLRDSMYEVVRAAALEKISNDEKLTAENFPYSEISWKLNCGMNLLLITLKSCRHLLTSLWKQLPLQPLCT